MAREMIKIDKEKIKTGGIYIGVIFAGSFGAIATVFVFLIFTGNTSNFTTAQILIASGSLMVMGIAIGLYIDFLRRVTREQTSDELEQLRSELAEMKKMVKKKSK